MFEDLFDTEEELLSGVKEGQVQSSWDRLPRNCADELPLPELPRKTGHPIGLKNQGATCYLNSLLQILFHTPQLRQIILELPLCKDTIQQKSDFLTHPSKHRFMLGFQRLFSEMSLRDTNDISTQYLKEAFGWGQGSEHVQQQDVEEAMKIIFDTFERALQGTQYEKNIKDLFRGICSQYKSCKSCTILSEKVEDFYGLTLQVKNIPSLQESMGAFLLPESMDGDNKIFCDTCDQKRDMWLGTKLKALPNILVFTFRRFEFDYERMDRVKINDFFRFDLEHSFNHYLDDCKEGQEFELYGVLIHRGSAHGGHYICYLRDIMQESDWENSLKQAQFQDKKIKESLTKQSQLTEEQKKRRQELQKEDKTHKLTQPENKGLLKNWFQLDDSRAKGIDVQKITSKYEGSESAYIAFYRKRGLKLPEKIQVPKYFRTIIEEQNSKNTEDRNIYDMKKKQIIMNIDGNRETLNISTKISDLLGSFCPPGFALVNEAKHNELPYYPMQFTTQKQFSDEDTIEKMDVIHESSWRKYEIANLEYQDIKDVIQKEKMPMQLKIVKDDEIHSMIFYQDQVLADMRIKIEHKLGIPYENQIIKVVTPYKEVFVTDDLGNDEVPLTKLGLIHECQAIIKELKPKDGENIEQKKVDDEENNLYCFIIERDDVVGIKRMYYDKNKTLGDLHAYIIEIESLPKDQNRRLRSMNGDRLFYQDQYEKKIQELNFDEEMIKIRIERGEIPVKGDICVRSKMQSLYQLETTPQMIEQIFDPNTTIAEAKIALCQIAGIDPQKHRIYMTDWMEQPVRPITRENLSLFDSGFSRQEVVCIRDLDSPIGNQLLILEVYETKIGTPQDVGNSFHFKIQQTKTLLDLKTELLKTQAFSERNLTPKQLRIREIKRDYMFGVVMRDHKKQLKNININSNKIVVQVMKEEEELIDDQIVLILKKRNPEKRIYEGADEVIFNAGKNPSMESLRNCIQNSINFEGENLILVKYVNYNFEWVKIEQKTIDNFVKGKVNNENQKKNKKKGKKEEEKKQNTKEEDNKKESEEKKEAEEKKQQKVEQNKQHKQEKQQKEIEKVNEEGKEVNHGGQKPKQKKKDKQKQNNQTKTKDEKKLQEALNLRKPPILLKDGDWIGWGDSAILVGDDLQTDEDLSLRALKKDKIPSYRPEKQGGFKLNLDF